MKVKDVEVQLAVPAASTAKYPCDCANTQQGGLRVSFLIDEPTAKRLKSRAGVMDLERHIYENIIKPAISSAAY